MTASADQTAHLSAGNGVNLKGVDYVELYVGNAQQAAHFYRTAFGFRPVAYAGMETGLRDRVSYLIQQNNIRLLMTSAIDADHPIAEHVKLHGDGVKDIALTVDNAALAFETAIRCGARPIAEPTTYESEGRRLVKATIGVYGDTVHSFIQRDDPTFLPNYREIESPLPVPAIGLTEVDHLAVCVEPGAVVRWVEFYQNALGFQRLHEESIETEYSAMNSQAVQDSSGKVKFVIMEPAPSKRKSQIEEYLSFYHGPGVQHLAAMTEDIITTIRSLRATGVEFRPTPATYYDTLESRIGPISEDIAALREQHILVDRDQWGYLLQIFARPTQSRPTLFCEVIERKGALGFGSGNIKALFESIERDQALRGTL